MNEPIAKNGGAQRPKVLLTDTNRWALAARLAVSLADAGCVVTAICPAPSHALMKTRAVSRVFRYNALRPLESLTAAIEAADPDIVIPSCDRSAEHLHELYVKAKSRGEAGRKVADLIERSLGSPKSYTVASTRYELLALAREEGVRVPNMQRIHSQDDFIAWQATEKLPWVIKADGTWGGIGVRVVQSADQSGESCRELERMSRFTRALKRWAVNRDPFMLRSWWRRVKRPLIVQSYINGRPANCTVFSRKGRVIAAIGVEVVRSEGSTGPASVVRIVNNAEMMFAAEKVAARLGLSGFFGLDFMIEEGTEAAYLIEMNPRLTPPCYLRLGQGRDLAGAVWAQLTGQAIPDHAPVTDKEKIAYLPEALRGNRDLLVDCFQDVPQNEPELVEELLNPFPDRTFLFRMVQYFNRKRVVARIYKDSNDRVNGDMGEARDDDRAVTRIDMPIKKTQSRST